MSQVTHPGTHSRLPRLAGLGGLLATAALGVAACGDDEDSASTPAAAPKPTVLAITTTDIAKGFSMKAPATIKGGLVEIRFTNASKAPHEAQLVRMEDGHTRQEVLKLLATDTTEIPDWLRLEGGVAGVKPGETKSATQNLEAGRYVITDSDTGAGDGPPPSTRGAIADLTVTAGTAGDLPKTTATITATDDGEDRYRWETAGLKAGTNEVRFENDSQEAIHHVLAFPITGNATLADVKQAFTQQSEAAGPPPVDFANGLQTTALEGKSALVTRLTLRKGRYAFVCFLNDRDKKKPHLEQGLLAEVAVT